MGEEGSLLFVLNQHLSYKCALCSKFTSSEMHQTEGLLRNRIIFAATMVDIILKTGSNFGDFICFYGTDFGDSHQIHQIQYDIIRNVDKI